MLLRALVSCGVEEMLPGQGRGDETWPSVIYPLQMAASLENVIADPSFVDDSEAALWCETAWDRDVEDRREVSSYIAALTVFNFVWLAYEGAIGEAVGDGFTNDKVPVQGRKLLHAHAEIVDALPSLPLLYRISHHYCKGTGSLEIEADQIKNKYSLSGGAAAAELGRLFRNYVVHGDDPSPIYRGPDAAALYRFYAIAKMLLVLIQGIALITLENGDRPVPLSATLDRDRERAQWLLSNLHLRDELWMGRDPLGSSTQGD